MFKEDWFCEERGFHVQENLAPFFARMWRATTEKGRGPRCNLQGRGKKRDTGGIARGHFIRSAVRS